jgi:hypothetical protein
VDVTEQVFKLLGKRVWLAGPDLIGSAIATLNPAA